jgi:hypothetical protein
MSDEPLQGDDPNVPIDLDQLLQWKGYRVWLRLPAAPSTRQFGEIIHVFILSETREDHDLAIQLEDGSMHRVHASDKGTLWDMAD